MIASIGTSTIALLEELGNMVAMVKETASEIWGRIGERRPPVSWDQLIFQCHRVGVGSVPMVVFLSSFVGLTMALLTGYQLQIFGMVLLVPAVVSVSFIREMGPLFTGIVLAARIGAAYTAELGAMAAGGEVSAIEGMGIGSHRFLITPRFLAIVSLTPSLAVVSIFSGIFGATFISSLILHISYGFFFDQVMTNLFVKDVITGIGKSFLFGGIIGFIACYKGLTVRGGAAGVGAATTSSVVTAISAVIACDSLCNILIITFMP